METYNEEDLKYSEARKKVKKLKGLYVHAVVYVLVNLFIIASNTQQGLQLSDMDNYWTAIFWGVGLLAHVIGVYVPNIFLGKEWEERKTRELMDKYK